MRRALLAVVLGVSIPGASLPAWAGAFGGFSRDRSVYLDGAARICKPVGPRGGAPVCRTAAEGEVARLGFAKGGAERGAGAALSARASGSRLEVVDGTSSATVLRWNGPDPISRVVAVYRPGGKSRLVAIEYEVRVAGRAQVRTVVLELPAPSPPGGGDAGGGASAGGDAAAAPAPPPARPVDDKELALLLKTADARLKARKYKLAEASYRAVLDKAGDHARARFGLAAALIRQKKRSEAISELQLLSRSPLADAPVYLVEARTSSHFKPLLGDAGFRRAIGVDPDPSRPATSYERLVGQGGHWEQSGRSCQEPQVTLKLDRQKGKKLSFRLLIRNRCQGMDETTRLGGSWLATGTSDLALRFPNPGGPEEKLACKLGHDGREDTLECALDDLTFTMRVVRR
jgi:hypothetical protein